MTPPPADETSTTEPPRSIVQLATLLAMLSVWAVITVGIAFDVADVTTMYQYLTVFIAVLASRYWDIPAQLLSGSR